MMIVKIPLLFLITRLALSTSQLRKEYAPNCSEKGNLYASAYAGLNACLKKWKYRPEAHHTGAFNCRKITAGSGWSLHAYGPGNYFTFWNGVRIRMSLAVDINWLRNPWGSRLVTDMPIGMILDIEKIRTNSGAVVWRWGGRYSGKKDAMHFEIICSKRDLASGINWSTVPGAATPPSQKPTPKPTRPWKNILAGDTDRKVYARGGPDNAVSEVQIRLQQNSYNIGRSGIDGDYGPATQAAVVKYKKDMIAMQKKAGVKPWPTSDKVVGIATINSLRWWDSLR